MNITGSLAPLSFFKVSRYEYKREHTCDFSDCPRPHYCMGLMLRGKGSFYSDDGVVEIDPGDIIFVPITSKYISKWTGDEILYISMHFSFEPGSLFSCSRKFKLQKVTVDDFEKYKSMFTETLDGYDGDDAQRLNAVGNFYKIMASILKRLEYSDIRFSDKRIEKAVEYIDFNYADEFDVATLSELCHMSESHFYTCFKKNMGMSPVEYRLKVRTEHASLLLIDGSDRSIEEISDMVGFESSAYFRRVFKKMTGKSPREYRLSSSEV